MLLSMTGYGRATRQLDSKTFLVEIRSLNSKYSDLRLKCAQNLAEKEAELRRMVSDFAQRGKVEMTVEMSSLSGDEQFGLNEALFRKYYDALSRLCGELDYQDDNMMSAILRLPNVVSAADGTLSDDDWTQLRATVKEALERFQQFRRTEGAALATDLEERVQTIRQLLQEVAPFETQRVLNVRERLMRNLEEHLGKDRIDENRFEQEVLFYLEKMDINEEKVRLEQHCKYFLEILQNKSETKGRKLSFIGQEIGREINTLGAKAYSSDIQRIVVQMKDHLEKIKEQIANIV
jgi:uncharacterized protein (TIGR00255 family)